jgi:hypothetical protein
MGVASIGNKYTKNSGISMAEKRRVLQETSTNKRPHVIASSKYAHLLSLVRSCSKFSLDIDTFCEILDKQSKQISLLKRR